MTKLALVMIVKASDDEAEVLARALKHTAPHVDGIFLTITGKNKRCEDVAKLFNAHVSHYEWDYNFANARNFALDQVPKDYTHWFWIDCDDVPRGIEKLKKTVDQNPDIDVFALDYLYAFDQFDNPVVVHIKSRVLKNDGCVRWAGALHEDFQETRAVNAKKIEGIDILHLSNDNRFATAKKRNVEVARRDVATRPEDPRAYWNLANALKGDGEDQEAIGMFEKFLALSLSDEEKYIAHLRLAEIYLGQQAFTKALDSARLGIGIRPQYPDAYHTAGHVYFQMKKFTDARDMYQMGLTKKPPYNSIIVYNPRDYDYVPLISLAKCYYNLSLPSLALPCLEACLKIMPKDVSLKSTVKIMRKEATKSEEVMKLVAKLREIKDDKKLWKKLQEVPKSLQSHPAICNLRNVRFVKQESSGKDLVYFCGFTSEIWTPETAKTKGIGGSEEAVIHLTKRFAKEGWNVTVYNNCGYKEQKFDGVTYKPYWTWNPRDKQDVTIVWRTARPLEYGINSDKVFLDLHDVIPAGEFTEKRLENVNKIFVKSQAHRALFPAVPDEKFVVVPNGIEWAKFQQDVKRDPYLIINTSSPDRSLSALVECFAEVKKQVPKAKLKWAYGWNVWDSVHTSNPKAMEWRKEVEDKIKRTKGIEVLGRLGHEDIAKLYQEAQVFAYPTAFYEIDCISARKAEAGGAIPVATDFAALNETVQFGTKVKTTLANENWGKPYALDFALQDPKARKQWIAACVKALTKPMNDKKRKEMRDWTKQFDWEAIAQTWLTAMNG